MPDELTLFLPPHGINFQHRARGLPATESLQERGANSGIAKRPFEFRALKLAFKTHSTKKYKRKRPGGWEIPKDIRPDAAPVRHGSIPCPPPLMLNRNCQHWRGMGSEKVGKSIVPQKIQMREEGEEVSFGRCGDLDCIPDMGSTPPSAKQCERPFADDVCKTLVFLDPLPPPCLHQFCLSAKCGDF